MKRTKALFGILTITAALAMQVQAQTYSLNTSSSTGVHLIIADAVGGGSSGYSVIGVANLSATVYIDPVALTIRQVGTITLDPSPFTMQFQETEYLGFPTPQPVQGTVTLTLAAMNSPLSFDTGVQSMVYNAASGNYTFNGRTATAQDIPFSGTYSLVTGGQTNSGPLNVSVSGLFDANNGVNQPLQIFTTLSTSAYPTSVALSGVTGFKFASSVPVTPASVTAANGFEIKLGAQDWVSLDFRGFGGWVTATLAATNAPIITSQPQSQTVCAHTNFQFSVTAVGSPPLFYQWSRNSTNIAGATLSSLTISNVVQTNLGTYAVVVTNAVGSVLSSDAALSMYPFIAVPFAGAVTYWGKDATFSVRAWGTGPLNYQWFQNGVALENATNQTFTLTSMQFTNAGFYSLVVSSSLGSVTNPPAQVVVNPAGVSLGLCPAVTIDGVVGYNYIIRRTADLSNTNAWVTMTNLTLTQPVQLWVDTNVDASLPANPHHFYQVLPGQ